MGLNFFDGDIRTKVTKFWQLFLAHNHDGTNSPAVTVGTVADNAVTTAKIAANALAASAAGRGKVADGFFDAATLAAKIGAGAFAATTAIRALFADSIWPLAKLAATAKTHVFSYQVEDLAAGADIASRVILAAPAGLDLTLASAHIIPQGTAAGVDDGNTAVIALSDGTNTIVSKTYNTETAFPDDGAIADLGDLDADHKVLSAGEKLYLDVLNGATANLPRFMVQLVFTVDDAA